MWGERIGFSVTNPVGIGRVCLCLGCGGGGGVRYMCIVLGGYLAHLRCTQSSILLHLIDICFPTCICLHRVCVVSSFISFFLSYHVTYTNLLLQLPVCVSVFHHFIPLLLLLSTQSFDPCLWGGGPIIPLLVHQPAYPSIWPVAPSLQRGLSINPGVTTVVRM